MYDFGGKYWTKEETIELRQHYSSATREELLESLPDRTWYSITRKARRLELKMKTDGRDERGRFVEGRKGWNNGTHLSIEHRKKISEAKTGKGKISIPEGKLRELYFERKLSTIDIAELYNVNFATILARMDDYGMKRRSRSEALKDRSIPKEVRQKISEANKGKHHSSSTEFKKGHPPHISPKRQAENTKLLWKQEDYVKKQMRARHVHPNKVEKKLLNILKRNELPFRYVGDGEVIIGGLCPDFIHNDGKKKLIEVFGRAFHDPDVSFKSQIRWKSQYFGRMAYYSQHGYDCLILWDDELGNERDVINRIRRFA